MVISKVYHSDGNQTNTINSILGTLALVSLCYYNTMDNPYTVIITIIMASRLMYKLHHSLSGNIVHTDDIIGDSILIPILAYTGIIPQLNYDQTVVALYTIQGTCVSIGICKMVLHIAHKSSIG
jgi:hypothetical protein